MVNVEKCGVDKVRLELKRAKLAQERAYIALDQELERAKIVSNKVIDARDAAAEASKKTDDIRNELQRRLSKLK